MTDTVRDLLQAFDALLPAEKNQIAAEILRRCSPDEGLPDAALDELAIELFRSYDAEEDTRAAP
ncbi:MAG TPA: hypothetical protein VN688_04005 [Gemmataceae bacterium]|nr:hypothetical protein [Gemmataceae bacterium]